MTALRDDDAVIAERRMARLLAESAQHRSGVATSTEELHRWLAERREQLVQDVRRVPLTAVSGWSFHPDTGNLGHASGKFFTVEGVHVRLGAGPVTEWWQPIINQPEIGVLGLLVREIGGVLHVLVQAKIEPGNRDGVQLSPTVQATRSNYSRVHGGSAVPHLEHFVGADPCRIVADVLQSEQGSWFFRKRNRNMVVVAASDVVAGENFRWLTLAQVHDLLRVDNVVNMDLRTVLSCLPAPERSTEDDDSTASAVDRSYAADAPSVRTTPEVLRWITERQARHELVVDRVPLVQVRDWRRTAEAIEHTSGRFFRVIGVDVEATGREVTRWAQPLIEPCGSGVIAFLARRVEGVLHLLVHARVEPGYLDVIELGPTVQCTPGNYDGLPPEHRPAYLATALAAPRESILFEAELSEEGGRFHHAVNRYLVIDVGAAVPLRPLPGFTWLTLSQITGFLRYSHYVNVEARSLIACVAGLVAR